MRSSDALLFIVTVHFDRWSITVSQMMVMMMMIYTPDAQKHFRVRGGVCFSDMIDSSRHLDRLME